MDSDSDEALADRVAAGDASAYRQLVDRHVPRTLRLARRLTGNASDAEDVTQDAFLRLWQHGHRWQAGRARFTTWFYRIVVNLCIDRRRRPAFAPLEAAGDPVDDRPDAAAEIDRAHAALAAEPFDRQALEAAFEESRARHRALETAVQAMVLETAGELSPEGRRRLLRHRPRHGPPGH